MTMKNQNNQLRAGVYLSYINLLLGSLIPMFYTPVMLGLLGEAEHGLYSLANSAVGYLSLLSFGFGSTILRYLSKYRAENDKAAVQRTFGFFLVLYCALALWVMLGGWILAENAAFIFNRSLSAQELQKIKILILVMALHTALTFPMSVITSVSLTYERFIFRRVMDIISTVAGPAVNLIVLYMGYASVGMAVAGTVLQILLLIPNAFYCFWILGIKPTFERMPGSLIREMVGFSFYVFIGSIVDTLFWATDKVILGMLVGTVAVSVYQIGSTFNNVVIQLSTSISGVLTPKITGMVVKDAPKEALTELFIRVGRIQFLVVGLIVTGFAVFGQAFILLWAGEAYADAYWIAILTLFPLCIPLIQNTGLSIVVAQNKHKFRSIVYLMIAIANVISTYLVVPYLGGIGAALCSCISYLLGQGLIMNFYYHKVIGIDIPLFWKNILKMAIFPGVMMVVGLSAKCAVSFDNWITFFAGVVVYTAIYCLGMYRLNMNDYEKDIIRGPLKKVVSKIVHK